VEGERGDLVVFVVSDQSPKTSQSFSISLKPLSLHEKTPTLPLSSDLRLNKLQLSGSFSLNQMHSWIGKCLPDVPPHIAHEDVRLSFRSSFLGTVLLCEYHRGEALIMSDSVSAISIIKEVISTEATISKVHLSINLEIEPSSVISVLESIRPKALYHSGLTSQQSKIAALKAIEVQEGAEEARQFLSDEYVGILERSDEIERELEHAPRHLEFLRGVIRRLLVDALKLRGRSADTKLQQLDELLTNLDDFEAIIGFFRHSI
jgi:Bardet-Biedl syndrome 7 protein